MLDVKIMSGEILDGLGGPARRADIGITDDRITDIGDLSTAEATSTIDAKGKYIAPGFIDAHSHSDAYLLIEPSAQSKIHQGITTEIVGNCGASAAPLTGAYKLPSDWRDKTFPAEWSTVAEYRSVFEQVKPAINAAMLIGHNTLRAGVVGYDDRAATREEMERMKTLLEQALEEGGRGLSTGLIYAPGMFAPTEEIIELATVAAGCSGIYSSHMRNEGSELLAAITEAISIGRNTGIRVQISHLKAAGKNNWNKLDEAIALVEEARDEGLTIFADRYPYTAGCTDLDVIFPNWAAEGGADAILVRLADKQQRKRLHKDLLKTRSERDWDCIMISSTEHPDNLEFQGRKLTDVASELNTDPVDAALRLVEKDRLKTQAFFFGLSEENQWHVLGLPWVMLGTDASLRANTGQLSKDYPHPRAFGSFPLFLKASLDGRTVPLPEAIKKMTSLAAQQFDLPDRGSLEIGKVADIVIFNPKHVEATASYARPRELAKGIDEVIVNGIVTIKSGRPTGSYAGRFLAQN